LKIYFAILAIISCFACSVKHPPVDADGRPLIIKTGTIDRDLAEVTTVVFKNKLYRFEYVNPGYWDNHTGDSYFRFIDHETGKPTKSFAKGFHMGSAYIYNDTAYVTCVDHWDGERIYIFSSADLENWDQRLAIELPGFGMFNTSLTRDDNKFVLMFEIGKPEKEAGVPFTAHFATSTDLKKWEVLSSDHNYAKDRYTAPHCLRYLDGYYYDFYLEEHNGYETRVVRSKDLIHWESSPLNPVLKASADDRKIANDNIPRDIFKSIGNAEDCNNSDIDFCEFNGKIWITYAWGNQRGIVYLAEAYYDGSLKQFLKGWFPEK